MNIFFEYEGFFGKAEINYLRRQGTELLQLARSIRQQLGRQGYLLDSYLGMALEGLNASAMFDIANHCGTMRGELMGIISALFDGTDKYREHAFYPKANDYISAHPLPFQERYTRHSLYSAALADDFLEGAVAQFIGNLKERQRAAHDIVALRDLFRQISSILCCEAHMEQLNLLLRQRFQVVTPMSAFVQCLNESLLHALLYRDAESSKQTFQLLLEQGGGHHA